MGEVPDNTFIWGTRVSASAVSRDAQRFFSTFVDPKDPPGARPKYIQLIIQVGAGRAHSAPLWVALQGLCGLHSNEAPGEHPRHQLGTSATSISPSVAVGDRALALND